MLTTLQLPKVWDDTLTSSSLARKFVKLYFIIELIFDYNNQKLAPFVP